MRQVICVLKFVPAKFCREIASKPIGRNSPYKRLAILTTKREGDRYGSYRQRMGTAHDCAGVAFGARNFWHSALVHSFRYGNQQEISLVSDRRTPRTTGPCQRRAKVGATGE